MSVTLVADAIKARLAARLKDVAVPLVREVYAQADYAAVPESRMVTPSVAVIYTGYTPGPRSHAGAVQQVTFGWLISVNVRNARNADSVEAVQADASPIFDAVMDALLGWRPLTKVMPLQLEPAPGAALSDAGFGYYPVAFSTQATYRGTPTT